MDDDSTKQSGTSALRADYVPSWNPFMHPELKLQFLIITPEEDKYGPFDTIQMAVDWIKDQRSFSRGYREASIIPCWRMKDR